MSTLANRYRALRKDGAGRIAAALEVAFERVSGSQHGASPFAERAEQAAAIRPEPRQPSGLSSVTTGHVAAGYAEMGNLPAAIGELGASINTRLKVIGGLRKVMREGANLRETFTETEIAIVRAVQERGRAEGKTNFSALIRMIEDEIHERAGRIMELVRDTKAGDRKAAITYLLTTFKDRLDIFGGEVYLTELGSQADRKAPPTS